MATIAAQVTSTGISAPDYADILQELRIAFWKIYGSDSDLDDDTQDGQFLGILAQVIFDCNQTAIAVFNSYSPATAQGAGLSSSVKLNGLKRAVPTNSQAPVLIVGQVGRQIENGRVGDNLSLGTVWTLPPLVTIPISGAITVTATATEQGALVAAVGTLTVILTPTLGWQTVTNIAAATLGDPSETDAELRARQSRSVALPSQTILESIDSGVAAISGVGRLKVYENDSDVTDADGIPSHSVSVVVSGGDVTQVAEAIALEKPPGTGTFGTTSVVVTDSRGVPNTIKFFELTTVALTMEIDVHPLLGYVSTTGDLLTEQLIEFVNETMEIGEDSYLARLYTPANLGSDGLGSTYVISAIRQSRDGNPPAAANVVMSFNEAATLVISDVTLTIV